MDKSVYNMKAEKIQKHVKQGDYETAAKICETIDWTQVRSARMLSLVSSVYEHVGRYDTAIDILLMAYEEAPVGRRLLYKLTELAIASGNLAEAGEFYKSYIKEASDDNARYVLRYKIAEAKGESLEKRISILEAYKRQEFDEQWSYRLAELYAEAGEINRCVSLCDEIILWFGVGTYVDKTLELKEQFAPLTEEQMDHRKNRAVYEEHLRDVQRDLAKMPEVSSEVASSLASGVMEEIENGDDMPQVAIPAVEAMTNAVESGQQVSVDPSAFRPEDDAVRMTDEEEEAENAFAKTRRVGEKGDLSRTRIFEKGLNVLALKKAGEKNSDKPTTKVEPIEEDKLDKPTTKVEPITEEDEIQIKAEEPLSAVQMELDLAGMTPAEPAEKLIYVGASSPDEAMEIAIEQIKASHESENTTMYGLTKIVGVKLNKKGVLNSLEALKNKDLIILGASGMDDEILDEIKLVNEKFDTKKFFVFADSEAGIAALKARMEKTVEEAVEEPTEEPAVEEVAVAAVVEEAAELPEEPVVEAVEEITNDNSFAFDDAVVEVYDDDLPEIKLNDYFDDLEEASETAAEPVAEEAVEELAEEPAEEIAEEAIEEPIEEIAEEVVIEETVEEPIEEIAEEVVIEETVEEPIEEVDAEEELPEIVINAEPELQTSEQERAEEVVEEKEEPQPELQIEQTISRNMTPQDFMDYIKKYMKKIDCIFDEGAEAEVTEYINQLFGNGEQLDTILAEDMVEDAADAAESHSFGNMFKSRYSEEGYLLLRAKHFV